jgi:hypothetical protein
MRPGLHVEHRLGERQQVEPVGAALHVEGAQQRELRARPPAALARHRARHGERAAELDVRLGGAQPHVVADAQPRAGEREVLDERRRRARQQPPVGEHRGVDHVDVLAQVDDALVDELGDGDAPPLRAHRAARRGGPVAPGDGQRLGGADEQRGEPRAVDHEEVARVDAERQLGVRRLGEAHPAGHRHRVALAAAARGQAPHGHAVAGEHHVGRGVLEADAGRVDARRAAGEGEAAVEPRSAPGARQVERGGHAPARVAHAGRGGGEERGVERVGAQGGAHRVGAQPVGHRHEREVDRERGAHVEHALALLQHAQVGGEAAVGVARGAGHPVHGGAGDAHGGGVHRDGERRAARACRRGRRAR